MHMDYSIHVYLSIICFTSIYFRDFISLDVDVVLTGLDLASVQNPEAIELRRPKTNFQPTNTK